MAKDRIDSFLDFLLMGIRYAYYFVLNHQMPSEIAPHLKYKNSQAVIIRII
jgi:hypothetical protein